MAKNFLKLNDQETGSPVFRPLNLHLWVTSAPWVTIINTQSKNLAVILHDNVTQEKRIDTVVRARFFQLRVLAKVMPFLSSSSNFVEVTHAFVSSWLLSTACTQESAGLWFLACSYCKQAHASKSPTRCICVFALGPRDDLFDFLINLLAPP